MLWSYTSKVVNEKSKENGDNAEPRGVLEQNLEKHYY